MIPKTVGYEHNIGKIAMIQCIKNDTLTDIQIKGCCFLLLFIHEGSAYFKIGDNAFEAIGPCFVCFDEREQPELVKKHGLMCDSIYFHPQFLNVNMTFQRIHSCDYKQLALQHDMFLLEPFTNVEKYVFPLFEEYADNMKRLFKKLDNELEEQRDWYWSCRSRSFFLEIILMLERTYGIVGENDSDVFINKIKNVYVKNALIYIESHHHEKITLESITNAIAVNRVTLTKLFKSELDMTPIEYLWEYRITVAKKCLAFTDLSIKEIALRCGFKTLQHFCRKFEMCTKRSPTVYREWAVNERKKALKTM